MSSRIVRNSNKFGANAKQAYILCASASVLCWKASTIHSQTIVPQQLVSSIVKVMMRKQGVQVKKGNSLAKRFFQHVLWGVSYVPCKASLSNGLPLRLFVPQAGKKSSPWHPRAPRRQMSRRKVRNSKSCATNAALASTSIHGHGTLPLSSPSRELRGQLSARPSYGYCFSNFCPDIPQHRYLCEPTSTCFRPVFALPASFAAAAGIPLLLFARQVNVNQVEGFANPEHDALQGFNE